MNFVGYGTRLEQAMIEQDDQEIECPYCGGSGSQAWFETHEHVNPFGEHEISSDGRIRSERGNIDFVTAGILGTCLFVSALFFYGLYQFCMQVADLVTKVL